MYKNIQEKESKRHDFGEERTRRTPSSVLGPPKRCIRFADGGALLAWPNQLERCITALLQASGCGFSSLRCPLRGLSPAREPPLSPPASAEARPRRRGYRPLASAAGGRSPGRAATPAAARAPCPPSPGAASRSPPSRARVP